MNTKKIIAGLMALMFVFGGTALPKLPTAFDTAVTASAFYETYGNRPKDRRTRADRPSVRTPLFPRDPAAGRAGDLRGRGNSGFSSCESQRAAGLSD